MLGDLVRRPGLRFVLLGASFLAAVTACNAAAHAGEFTASVGMISVTNSVTGAMRGYSDREALGLMRRGVRRGLTALSSPYPSAPVFLQWTIRDPGRPARAWVDVYVPAHDSQPARHASDSVAASAAPTDMFVQAIASLTERALATVPAPRQTAANRRS